MNHKKINYISGLKGISCFMVMAGHFLGIFKYLESAEFDYSKFAGFVGSPFGTIINESFWLYLFFVASGYLLSMGEIDNLRSLIVKTVKRFLRLGMPVFFACVIIYVFVGVFGLHNSETVVLFENTWYQGAFSIPMTLIDVLQSPFDVLLLNKCIFNSPYWVLRDMFFNSILLYLCLYLQKKTRKFKLAKYLIAYTFLLFGLKTSYIACAFAAGMAIAQHEWIIKKVLSKLWWMAIPAVLIPAIICFLVPGNCQSILFFGAVIAVVPYIPFLERLLSRKGPQWLGKISFGIYSFHWPVFCSVGAWLLLHFTPRAGIAGAFVISAIISVIITFVLSQAYMMTVERFSAELVNKLDRFLVNSASS